VGTCHLPQGRGRVIAAHEEWSEARTLIPHRNGRDSHFLPPHSAPPCSSSERGVAGTSTRSIVEYSLAAGGKSRRFHAVDALLNRHRARPTRRALPQDTRKPIGCHFLLHSSKLRSSLQPLLNCKYTAMRGMLTSAYQQLIKNVCDPVSIS